jgi:hypothetical protein
VPSRHFRMPMTRWQSVDRGICAWKVAVGLIKFGLPADGRELRHLGKFTIKAAYDILNPPALDHHVARRGHKQLKCLHGVPRGGWPRTKSRSRLTQLYRTAGSETIAFSLLRGMLLVVRPLSPTKSHRGPGRQTAQITNLSVSRPPPSLQSAQCSARQ